MRLVHADVVLIAVEALAVLLGPPRILVFLGILGGRLLPILGRLAGLDLVVLVPAIALLGRRYDARIDDLAATRNVALGLEVLAEAAEQLVDQPRLGKSLPKQPDGRRIRHRVLETQGRESA